jgi:hypothetical protein
MNLPVHDWQFWAVTAATLFAAAWLCRGLVPRSWVRRGARGTKVSLTIERGKRPNR